MDLTWTAAPVMCDLSHTRRYQVSPWLPLPIRQQSRFDGHRPASITAEACSVSRRGDLLASPSAASLSWAGGLRGGCCGSKSAKNLPDQCKGVIGDDDSDGERNRRGQPVPAP